MSNNLELYIENRGSIYATYLKLRLCYIKGAKIC